MRVFQTICRDTKTNGYMVLSEVSYNNACYWLEGKGFECITCQSLKDNCTRLIGKMKEKFGDRILEFLYDENRGYLIRINGGKSK